MARNQALVIIFFISLCLSIILACSISFPAAQKAIKFSATDLQLEQGECTYLFWDVGDSKNAKLNDQFVSPTGTQRVCPEVSTSYILSYESDGGTDYSQIMVQVIEPQAPAQEEVSLNFWVDDSTLNKGECTALHWNTTGGSVRLDGKEVDAEGFEDVCPNESQEYTLVVGDNLSSKTIQIIIQETNADSSNNSEHVQVIEPKPIKESEPLTFTLSADLALPAGFPLLKIVGTDFTFTNSSIVVTNGTKLSIHLNHPANVTVYLGGILVPKKTSSDGKTLVVTVPTSFKGGYVELKGDGIYAKSSESIGWVDLAISFQTDLAVTDLYPDNQPIGEIYARITNRGPAYVYRSQINLVCGAKLEVKPGAFIQTANPINTQKNYLLTIKHNETQIFDTGIKSDTGNFFYSITCMVRPNGETYSGENREEISESNWSNNTYSENF